MGLDGCLTEYSGWSAFCWGWDGDVSREAVSESEVGLPEGKKKRKKKKGVVAIT